MNDGVKTGIARTDLEVAGRHLPSSHGVLSHTGIQQHGSTGQRPVEAGRNYIGGIERYRETGDSTRICEPAWSKPVITNRDYAIGSMLTIAGLFFLLAELYHLNAVTHIQDSWPNIKVTTAISFAVAGRLICERVDYLRASYALFLLLIILSGFGTTFTGLSFSQRVIPEHEPSVSTLACFMLFVVAEVLHKVTTKRIAGGLIVLAVMSSTLGYALGIPELYFEWQFRSEGMSVPTTVLFALTAIYLLSTDRTWEHSHDETRVG